MKIALVLSLLLPMATVTALAQGTSEWKTVLAAKEELQGFPPGQVEMLEGGVLHVRAPNGLLLPQPGPDGAIRARFHFREKTGFPQLRIRRNGNAEAKNTDYYEVIAFVGQRQQVVKELYVNATVRGKGRRLGVVPLAKPFALGDHLDVELFVVGDHLQVSVDGKVAFETHDGSISTGGYWGLASLEAWFSNVQVRPLLPKSTDPRILQLEEAYAAAIAREVTTAHDQAVRALDEKYLAALERALEAATQAARLDDALALQAERKRLGDKAPLPADDTTAVEPLKPLRLTYRQSLAQLEAQRAQNVQPLRAKFLQALATYEEELTRAQNLDEATKVRQRREFEQAAGSR